jgi:hypothetical protein
MAWRNVHPAAPTDDDDRPVHPEQGYTVCGYEKTDATDKLGKKRHDIPYCLLSAGWGTDRETGHCSKHNGHGPGAKEGWANQNARHLLYSERMNDDDREAFKRLVDVGDGDHVPIDEFRSTLSNMIAFEEMRLTRAIGVHPDVDQIGMYECPRCGKSYRRSVTGDAAAVDRCTGSVRVEPQVIEPCEYSGELDDVPGKSWVEFGDDAVEQKQAHIARLIKILNRVAGTQDVTVSGDHDVSVEGGEDPIDVNITNVGVDLPDDVDDGEDDDGGDE